MTAGVRSAGKITSMGQTDNCTVLPYHSLVTQGLSSGLSVSALDGLFFPGTVQLQLVAPELPAHGIYWEKTVHGISTCWARNSFLFLSFKRWFLSKKRILNNFFLFALSVQLVVL